MTNKIDLLKFLKSINNFNDFERELSKLSNQTQKGDLFEIFCQAYLEVIHPQEFKSVTLFKNTKSPILDKLNLRITKDYGIDLIAITDSDEIWAIQSKYRQSNQVTWRELSTFRSSSENADFMLVMGNLNQVLHPHKVLSRYSSILKYDFERLDVNDFLKIKNYLGSKEKVEVYKPRSHQTKAINNAIKHFKNNSKGQMIHACGTGKTLTSLWIKEKLKPKTTIVYLPSLALLKQTLEQWSKHKKDKFNVKCVCSDSSVTKETEIDEPEIDIQELGVPVTTSEDDIIQFLKSKGDKVVFATYQSAPVILNAIKSINFKFDFGVFDEAHKTASKSNKLFAKCLNTPISKSMFMTATPKLYAPALRKKASDEDIILCSMDDENIYGKVFDEVRFGEAIKLGLLSDYKIKVMIINDEEIKELIDRRYWLEVLERELTADELAKAWALLKSYNEVNHVISFHSRVRGAKDFQKNIEKLEEYLKEKGRTTTNIKSYHISGAFPTYQRSEILKEFIEEEKSLVTNARCLTEGVDVPAIDGVYFVDPKKNIIDIVQATGRAIRKKKSKYGYVIIPVYVKETENVDEIISSTAFEQVWKVVEAMKDQDERLQQIITELKILEGKKKFGSLKSRELSEQRKLKSDLANVLDLEDSILPKNIDIKDFIEKIGIKTLEVVGGSWDERFGEYKAFKENKGREPLRSIGAQSLDENKISYWMDTQRSWKKSNKLSKERIAKLNSINFNWGISTTPWQRSFEKYKLFKQKKDREPVSSSKDKIENFLGTWAGTQRTRYNRNNLPVKRIKKLNSIDFNWNLIKSSWNNAFKDYISFKNKHNQEPINSSKNESEKYISKWAGHQRTRYNHHTLSQDKVNRLNSVGFIWAQIENQWIDSFKRYKKFKEKYNREPLATSRNNDERSIATWVSTQKTQYNKNKLAQERIDELNLTGIVWNFLNSSWDQAFNDYKIFKKKHNREPSGKSKDELEKNVGVWASRQRIEYNKDNLSKERISTLESVGIIWDQKENSWNRSFKNYKEFKGKYNCEPSNGSKKESEKIIAGWATKQRTSYKQNKVSQNRINKLNSIDFIWDIDKNLWGKSYEYYKTFKEEHNCEPSNSSKIKSESFIARWASLQRKKYAKGNLSKEEIEKLNSIDFSWGINEDLWNKKFNDYKIFKEKHNYEPTQRSKNKDEKIVGAWANRQRVEYNKNNVPKDRINKLNSIGFIWIQSN